MSGVIDGPCLPLQFLSNISCVCHCVCQVTVDVLGSWMWTTVSSFMCALEIQAQAHVFAQHVLY